MTDDTSPETAARERILDAHRDTVAGVLAAADAVADGWPAAGADQRSAVSDPLERALRERGLLADLVTLLSDAVAATGRSLPATPVPAPPYLAVTGRGPVLRAALDGGRLVVRVDAFDVRRNPRRYVRSAGSPEAALTVEFRRA